jgi:hypothetical protein
MTYFKLLNAARGAGRRIIMCGGMPLKDQKKGRDGNYYPFLGSDGTIYNEGDIIPEGVVRVRVPRDFWANLNEEREGEQMASARRPQLPQLNDDANDIIDRYRELGNSATVTPPPPKSRLSLNDVMYSSTSSRPVSSPRIQPSASRRNWTGIWSDDEDDDDLQNEINRQSLSTLRGMHDEADEQPQRFNRSGIARANQSLAAAMPSSASSPLIPRQVLNDGGDYSSDDSSSGSSTDTDISNARAVQPNRQAPNRSSNIPYIIAYITDLVIKLDLFFNAKIKPTINTLNQVEVDNIRTKTAQFVSTVRDFYISNRARIDDIENGTELYSNLQDKTNILGNDVLIATNSYAVQRKGGFLMHSHPSLGKYKNCEKNIFCNGQHLLYILNI